MPYGAFKLNGNKYEVKNVKTGEISAKGTTKSKADSQIRLLNQIEKGFKPGRRNV
jgi:hypothetical protein